MVIDEIRGDFERLQDELLQGPIYPNVAPEEIRHYLTSRYDFTKAIAMDEVVADVEQMLRTWQVQVTHPRYFGLFNPSVTLASVIADTLVAMYNPQLASWRTSPAANEIERHTLGWLTAKFGLPTDTLATFTNGGSEANFSAVVVALTRAFPRYGEDGVRCFNATPTIYLTDEAHHSFSKIAHMTGLGRNALRTVATTSDLMMDLEDLEKQVAEDRKNGFLPLMVIGTGGTTTAGIIDPLPELGRFCRDAGLWFHVDAAWGGAAILSPTLRHHLAGIEAADSITCDAHKWFSVSMGSGMFFCRHPESVAEAFRAEATYMPGKATGPAFDPYTTSVQWSRRFIGLKLFLSLAQQGESGYAAMIEHQTRMANMMRDALIISDWHIVNTTPLPVICFTRDGLDITQFLASLRERQIAWMSEGKIKGASVVRACVTSFKTTESDIHWVVGEMNRLVARDAVHHLTPAEY
ncbi:MAG TPA: pyridoxal-dependent decarboxylase [Acidobacteriaceae bacterium]|jgi:glutamate/tyrosine decarboxylase-like PLP-dependent enzyme|nr:pyridoxal-dependent decarboxylase [Acidobacteriaceae bacterium]